MKRFYSLILCMAIALTSALVACSSDDDGGLSVSPDNLTFSGNKDDSHSLNITTDGKWTILHCPEWLRASSMSGTGNSTVTLTTTSDNNQGDYLSDQVQIQGGGTTVNVNVRQDGLLASCHATPSNDAKLVMSYGIVCPIITDNNTKYFRYHVYTEAEWTSISTNSSVVEAKVQSDNWKTFNIDATTTSREVSVLTLSPDKRYVLVTMPYDLQGQRGSVGELTFQTQPATNQPLVTPMPDRQTLNTTDGGVTGMFYRIKLVPDEFTGSYYTYVCAGPDRFPSMTGRSGSNGTYNPRNGILMAWELQHLEISNDLLADNDAPEINRPTSPNTREKAYMQRGQASTVLFQALSSDKYIEIVTWGIDLNGNKSGLVYDVVYDVTSSGTVNTLTQVSSTDPTPGTDPTDPSSQNDLDVVQTTLEFPRSGGTKNIQILSDTQWQATSDASWCTLGASFGWAPSAIKVTVSANNTGTDRQATVTINAVGSSKKSTVIIKQSK